MHLPALIRDLAIILGLAGAVLILFRWIRQPVVLGYLLVGILAGPHVPIFPTVTDTPNIQILAELGVIFLLFGLGLEFSFRKLARVGFSITVIALVEIGFMGAAGFFFGQLAGWSSIDSLFLGAMLSISSTTIIIRALDALKLKSHRFSESVFGVLIVEDLVAILILLALSTIAVSRTLEGGPLLLSLGKFALIAPVAVTVGILVVPALFARLRKWMDPESLLIVALGLCLLLVLGATELGYSAALGAFLMGAILAEAPEGRRIEKLIHPVQTLFGAIFFVSVGMLFDPGVLVQEWKLVLVITLLTVIGKAFSSSLGALIAAQPLKESIQIGFSLAQIGEFSFIIASLGASLKVTSPVLYPVAVAVALITSFTTPYMIRMAIPFAAWLEEKLSLPVRNLFLRYQNISSRLSPSMGSFRRWTELFQRIRSSSGGAGYDELAPWDAHLARIEIPTGTNAAGKTLRDLNLRGRLGVNIVAVERAGEVQVAPHPDQLLLPLDELIVLGSDEQLQQLRNELEPESRPMAPEWDYRLVSVRLEESSRWIGSSIRQARIREDFQALVVGIERNGKRLLNPSSDDTLLKDDLLWIVCPIDRIGQLGQPVEITGA